LTLLFISRDSRMVQHMGDRVAVMYLGRIVESGEAARIYAAPKHPYTIGLLESVPKLRLEGNAAVEFRPISGELPSPLSPPLGCPFHPRCPRATEVCRVERPALTAREDGLRVTWHWADTGSNGHKSSS
jgi:oligopeptide/dipeptide ABC transporter ATP-binding protein